MQVFAVTELDKTVNRVQLWEKKDLHWWSANMRGKYMFVRSVLIRDTSFWRTKTLQLKNSWWPNGSWLAANYFPLTNQSQGSLIYMSFSHKRGRSNYFPKISGDFWVVIQVKLYFYSLKNDLRDFDFSSLPPPPAEARWWGVGGGREMVSQHVYGKLVYLFSKLFTELIPMHPHEAIPTSSLYQGDQPLSAHVISTF